MPQTQEMFTPLRQRENELLHKLSHGALQVMTHTAWVGATPKTTLFSESRYDFDHYSLKSGPGGNRVWFSREPQEHINA